MYSFDILYTTSIETDFSYGILLSIKTTEVYPESNIHVVALYDTDTVRSRIPDSTSGVLYERWDDSDGYISYEQDYNKTADSSGVKWITYTVSSVPFDSTEYLEDPERYSIRQSIDLEVLSRIPREYPISIDYTYEKAGLLYNNLDIHRHLSYFPAWSTAYKLYFSNTSKIISPVFEAISSAITQFESAAIRELGIDQIGYIDADYFIYVKDNPSYINTEYGRLDYFGTAHQNSIEDIPIEYANLEDVRFLDTYSYSGTSINDVDFIVETSLYVSGNGSVYTPIIVPIHGLDSKGNKISEVISLTSEIPVETKLKYRYIISAESDETEITISNHLDPTSSHSYIGQYSFPTRITRINGNYFNPLFKLEDNSLFIHDGVSSTAEEYIFNSSLPISNLVVSNALDLLTVYNNTLYTSKLMLSYYDKTAINSTTNNNDYVLIDDVNTPVGSNAQIIINTESIKKNIRSPHIKISIKNQSEELFLSSDLSLVEDKDTWIKLDNTGNQIIFSLLIENKDPYIISVDFDRYGEIFYGYIYQNNIDWIKTNISDIEEIFVFDSKLVIRFIDGSIKRMIPIRGGFIVDNNIAKLPYNFNTVEVYYD